MPAMKDHWFSFSLVIGFTFFILSGAHGQSTSFLMAGYRIEPGTKKSFDIPVVSQTKDSTVIPVTVVCGRKPGPVLALIAGIHGYEYPPIIAMQQMALQLQPDSVSGTVIIVHIANVKAFLGRSVYYNPVDGKNLNREFPGDKNGSLTQCIAWTISHTIIPKCQYLIDIHAGDASEDLHDYVAYYDYGEQTVTAQRMAEAMGFNWIIKSDPAFREGQPTRYCTKESIAQGIPTIAIECGKLGVVGASEIIKINTGLLNVMRSLKILSGNVQMANTPMVITKREFVNSEQTGIFYTDCKSGQLIRKGIIPSYNCCANIILTSPAAEYNYYLLSILSGESLPPRVHMVLVHGVKNRD